MDWTLLLRWHLESQRNFVLKNLDKCYGHLVGTNQGCPTTHRIVKELTSPKCNSLLSWSILSLSDPCLNINFHSHHCHFKYLSTAFQITQGKSQDPHTSPTSPPRPLLWSPISPCYSLLRSAPGALAFSNWLHAPSSWLFLLTASLHENTPSTGPGQPYDSFPPFLQASDEMSFSESPSLMFVIKWQKPLSHFPQYSLSYSLLLYLHPSTHYPLTHSPAY